MLVVMYVVPPPVPNVYKIMLRWFPVGTLPSRFGSLSHVSPHVPFSRGSVETWVIDSGVFRLSSVHFPFLPQSHKTKEGSSDIYYGDVGC